jgi:hypothetical protein
MGVVGDLDRFTQFQAATAIEAAAANPSGGGGEGMGLGMGFAMAQRMAESLGTPGAPRGGPPPLPGGPARYYLGVGGQQSGPYDLSGLRAEIQAGRLVRSTLVWKEGMSSWEPADRVAEVASLLSGSGGPPPLPA